MNDHLLQVKNLHTYFYTHDGIAKAVDGIDFTLDRGETLGLVGESGCGKSVTARSILQLIQQPPGRIVKGEILFDGQDLLNLTPGQMRKIRGNRISMIFQEPMTSLNPVFSIGDQMTESIRLHQGLSRQQALERSIDMLKEVAIPDPEKRIREYPHQLSGGMRQRVMIAMALSCQPRLLIADEPTTALDVTIQAQILEIIKDLTVKLNTAVILVTHDLGVVSGMCNNICVMYAGRIVERASTDDMFSNPKHPYTRGLIRSVPRLDKTTKERLYSIPGTPPSLINIPECCPFHPRCQHAMDVCRVKYPDETDFENEHKACCWIYGDSNRAA